jgi:AraC-like DNA-binding protein
MSPKRHVYIWERKTLYATTSNETGWHRHFGASIAVSPDRPFRLETRKNGRDYMAALVPPNLEHRALAPEARMIVLLVDPDSPDFRPLLGGLTPSSIQDLDPALFSPCLKQMKQIIDGSASVSVVEKCAEAMVRVLQREAPSPLDSRIEGVLLRIRSTFPDVPPLALLAREQEISPNRLMTLFKASLGLPIRRYLLWIRLRESVRWLEGGANLTDTAHAAGFADSAHLSRVFRENFGMPPSVIFSPGAATVVRILDSALKS